MKYKNLYFDLDRTLWDFQRNSELTLTDIISRHAPELYPNIKAFIETYHHINEILWIQYRNGEIKKDVLRTKRFDDSLANFGIKNHGLAKIIGDDYINESPYKTILFPHAIESLEYLKHKGYNLYLLTNGFLEVQIIKIRESNLMPFFDKMITSDEAGFQKPHKKIFEYALKTVNSKKVESIMIGDDVENDIMGAKRFGMDTVYFNPEKLNINIKPTYEISDLFELKNLF